MPKTYEPNVIEPQIANRWLEHNCFKRSKGVGDCTVCIPPPNVTGVLHMGHAMGDTIQDAFVRFNRMKGISTRWILGTDHAGIATQTKVDKRLKEQGISRLEIGREAFIDACWDWTREYGGIILEQIKRMGCSIDFSDEKFTMSSEYAYAVRKVFCDWYNAGLIYRGKRIVNWCPQCTTAISDDEAEYRDEEGYLWFLRYPLKEPIDGQEYIVVATTRPETMLGDTGVAVSTSEAYEKYVGASVVLPIVNREIPIFADWHVDENFGTGFVKVTPAHDPNDYAMGQTHGVEQINVFDERARVVEGYGEFSGLSREECREAVVAWFEHAGLLDHIEEHAHSVMHCYRCDTKLEPWLSEQWFVGVDKLKDPALEVVKNRQVAFHPKRWEATYTTWMENLKDWCISRQLWWGHRIPVFYCSDCGYEGAQLEDITACPQCASSNITQDENVLDTWFSSQLWTFATQGWPNNLEELQKHHPTKVLVTARDIIALWVARMVMSSLYFTGEIPFEDVFIYATILAKDGSRMSKSKGNGVDPMRLIELYGADAMRFNLLSLITGNQDVRFDAVKDKNGEFVSPNTAAAKSFVTKIWNATRFVLMNMEGFEPGSPKAETIEDAWMFSKLARQVTFATEALNTYNFGEYAKSIQSFFWGDFCDWYIELCKNRLLHGDAQTKLQVQRNLMFVLDTSMRLLHPAMPFVTEAIFEQLKGVNPAIEDEFLMLSNWPEVSDFEAYVYEEAEAQFELAQSLVSLLRSVRAQYRLSPHAQLEVAIKASEDTCKMLKSQHGFITSVGKVLELSYATDLDRPAESISCALHGMHVYVVLGDLVDLQAEKNRLQKEFDKCTKELGGLEKTLGNPGFIAKAALEIIEKKQEQKAKLQEQIGLLSQQISDLG